MEPRKTVCAGFVLFGLALTPAVGTTTPPPDAPPAAAIDAPLPLRLDRPPLPGADLWPRARAVQRALEAHPGLVAARARLLAAEGSYRSRSAADAPILQLGATWVPHPDPLLSPATSKLFDTDQSLLTAVLPTSGRRTHATQAAGAQLDVARLELAMAVRERARAVMRAYVDVQEADRALDVQERAWAVAETFVALSTHQLEQGAVPETHVIRARIERGRAEQQLLQTHGELRARRAQLAFETLGTPAHPIGAADPLIERAARPDRARLAALALASRPDVGRAQAQARSLAAEVEVVRAGRRPDLTVRTTFTDQLTNTGNPPFSAALSLPLWDRGRIGGEVTRARAAVKEAAAMVELTQGQVGLELQQAADRVDAAILALDVCRDEVVPATRVLLERARIAYVSGAGSVLDVLDAQRVYRQSGLELAKAQADLERTLVDLEYATGASTQPLRTTPGVTRPR